MPATAAAGEASAIAIQAAAGIGLWAEPEWLAKHAGDPAYEWARVAWRRAAVVPGAWFDEAKADAVVELWPQVFRLTEDRFANVPFRLLEWQALTVRLLVGWKVPIEVLDPLTGEPTEVHVRLFKRLMLWVPRKAGKSEFLAALGLLFWAIEGVVGGQGFVFARDEKQAKVVFNKMKAMIAYAPDLASETQSHARSIYLKPCAALFELLTGAESGKHGKSPTVIVGDEMHEWRSREVETTLRQGTGARLQPIELYGSTAGLKSNPTGVALWDESVSILDGRIEDATTLVVMFAADPDADWRDEEAWRRANPSLGLSPTLAFLRREAAIAKDNPRAEAHFRRYHLNQWVDAAVRWLNVKKWDACAPDPTAWKTRREQLLGRRCLGAFDVSSTRDVTALVWAFEPIGDEKSWQLLCRFWVPEETLIERVKNDRVSYDKWVAAGAMETTPGDYVDQAFVRKAILEGMSDFDVQLVGYDPWNATGLIGDLQREGVEAEKLVLMRQGIQTLGEPTKQFERLIYAGQLDHGGHPVLRWMAGNAVVRFDENMNFAPAKKRSAEKIDGIVAGVMAIGLSIANEVSSESFWQTESA
ncbi:terminase TerL endonuclease subunit [Bradyrhizobium sp.]|uniref:terminase large subunit n=1 Tax=Bradyrhizobium sp. TaxID=376 RepID=UPI0025BE4741|nr:terminase TerL endonuclease subunit [Bradyrhizobium sp.]MCA3254941.1 terminase large subunit [Alphaproteobacteria bacterium]MCA3568380.1 terminase large subunit [Bradyrhizobium sp.]